MIVVENILILSVAKVSQHIFGVVGALLELNYLLQTQLLLQPLLVLLGGLEFDPLDNRLGMILFGVVLVFFGVVSALGNVIL